MRTAMVAAAAIVCGACGGGGGSGPVTVNGNIGGQPMGAQDAVSNVLSVGGSDSEGAILFTNAAGTCAKLTAGQQPKNAKAILIEIGNQTATGVTAPTATGTYTVYTHSGVTSHTGNVAVAEYVATDANCNATNQIEANGGTVTLNRVDSSGYSGTYTMTLADGSSISGSFTANKCAALSQNIGGTCI